MKTSLVFDTSIVGWKQTLTFRNECVVSEGYNFSTGIEQLKTEESDYFTKFLSSKDKALERLDSLELPESDVNISSNFDTNSKLSFSPFYSKKSMISSEENIEHQNREIIYFF